MCNGDFVFADIFKDKNKKVPFVVAHYSNGKYYILGDGSHYVSEDKLSLATEKDFDDYYTKLGFDKKAIDSYKNLNKSSIIDSDFNLLGNPKEPYLLTPSQFSNLIEEKNKILGRDYSKLKPLFEKYSVIKNGYEKIKDDVFSNPLLAYYIAHKSENSIGYADTSHLDRNKIKTENAKYLIDNIDKYSSNNEFKKYIKLIYFSNQKSNENHKNIVEDALRLSYKGNETPEQSKSDYKRAIDNGEVDLDDVLFILKESKVELTKELNSFKYSNGGAVNEEQLYYVVAKKKGQLVDVSELPMTKSDCERFIKEQGIEKHYDYNTVDIIPYRGNKPRFKYDKGGAVNGIRENIVLTADKILGVDSSIHFVSDNEFTIEPMSEDKKFDGMALNLFPDGTYEVAEFQAGESGKDLYIFGNYKSLVPALKSLALGNSSTGRKPIKIEKFEKGGSINDKITSKAKREVDFLTKKGYDIDVYSTLNQDAVFGGEKADDFIIATQGSIGKGKDVKFAIAYWYRDDEDGVMQISRGLLDEISELFKGSPVVLYTNAGVDLHSITGGKHKNIQVVKVPYGEFSGNSDEYEKGGFVSNENAQMVLNQNHQIKHHTEELGNIVNEKTHVPAWVVSKVSDAANDLSDATHYLDGEHEKNKS